jgi:hypothetical protein
MKEASATDRISKRIAEPRKLEDSRAGYRRAGFSLQNHAFCIDLCSTLLFNFQKDFVDHN